MVRKKGSKASVNTPIDQYEKVGFFKRFAMFFEGVFILLLTAGLLYGSRLINVPEYVVQLAASQRILHLQDILTIVGISAFGLLLFLMRYNSHLRKKVRQEYDGEEDFKRLAFFDPLTNLPNKALCYDRLEHAIARATTNNTSVAVISIGIDDFKLVNKKQGNEGGDNLLKEITKRLMRELTPSDTLARVTGVEFVIILESVEAQDNITALADKILSKLVKNYRISMEDIYITGNIGIAMYPNDGDHSKALMNNADTAMNFAKEQGVNSLAFFSKDLQDKVNQKKNIAKHLRNALEKEELSLHYQPIVDSVNYQVIGVEALLRWHNKQLGDVSPDVFIPIAEEIGLINKIGDWVLTQACQQNKIWHEQTSQKIVMSVNLSAMQFAISNYATTVGASLAASGLQPEYLELEFTENTLMADVKQSIKQLKKLSELGVSIALDDFGTGYSSMQYLPKFTLNRLKIDGKFLKQLPDNVVDTTIIKTITALAEQLSLKITAEGVETELQSQFIKSCNIEAMQGYHFSKPVTAELFSNILNSPTWQVKSSQVIEQAVTSLDGDIAQNS